MKLKLIVLIAAFVLSLATVSVYAYNAGYCLKVGCHCHQFTGYSDTCTTCGHSKAAHL